MWYVEWMKQVKMCLEDGQAPVVVYQKGFCENGEIKADPTGKLGKGLGHSQRGEVRFLVGEKKQSIIRIAAESMPSQSGAASNEDREILVRTMGPDESGQDSPPRSARVPLGSAGLRIGEAINPSYARPIIRTVIYQSLT